jgi:hypothetical protein
VAADRLASRLYKTGDRCRWVIFRSIDYVNAVVRDIKTAWSFVAVLHGYIPVFASLSADWRTSVTRKPVRNGRALDRREPIRVQRQLGRDHGSGPCVSLR